MNSDQMQIQYLYQVYLFSPRREGRIDKLGSVFQLGVKCAQLKIIFKFCAMVDNSSSRRNFSENRVKVKPNVKNAAALHQ